MCIYVFTRYTCTAEAFQLVQRCEFHGACLPHIQEVQTTEAVCNLCADAWRWSEQRADQLLEMMASERERMDNIHNGDVEDGDGISEGWEIVEESEGTAIEDDDGQQTEAGEEDGETGEAGNG